MTYVFVAVGTIIGTGFGFLTLGLFQRWLLNYLRPDPELRSQVMSLSRIRWFGSFWAVRELLDQSVLQGGEKPI